MLYTSMKMKKEDIARGLGLTHKVDPTSHVGNKVLPITESTQSASSNNDDQNVDKKEKPKGDKPKPITRMKELLRWAAAMKAEKRGYISRKVLHFRKRAALKAVPDEDQLSNDSPKISFRWDVESCSTINSKAYSAVSMPLPSSSRHDHKINAASFHSTPLHVRDRSVVRTASWITTDSDFVVLEL